MEWRLGQRSLLPGRLSEVRYQFDALDVRLAGQFDQLGRRTSLEAVYGPSGLHASPESARRHYSNSSIGLPSVRIGIGRPLLSWLIRDVSMPNLR